MTVNPILAAIDTTDLAEARRLARTIAPHIGGLKLGLEFFNRHGLAVLVTLFPPSLQHELPET